MRQATMALVHRLGERERAPGTDRDQPRLFDPEPGCDLVGGAEADTADVAVMRFRELAETPIDETERRGRRQSSFAASDSEGAGPTIAGGELAIRTRTLILLDLEKQFRHGVLEAPSEEMREGDRRASGRE